MNKQHTSKIGLLMLAIATVIFFIPSLSMAANIFEPASNDISMKVLSQLFGKLVAEGGGIKGGADPILDAITTFNGCVLMIGGILAGYTILAGTIGTAHDGEMLGKKFSSVWIPIRYSLGTALVLPVIGGYAIIQLLVMWLVTQGVGLADNVWASYATRPPQSANATLSIVSRENAVTLAEDLYRIEFCLEGQKRALKEKWFKRGMTEAGIGWHEGQIPQLNRSTVAVGSGANPDNFTTNYRWAGSRNSMFDGLCGTLQNIDTSISAPGGKLGNNGTTNPGRLGDLSNVMGGTVDFSPVAKAQNTAAEVLRVQMATLAKDTFAQKKDIEAVAPALYKQLLTSANAYSNTVQGVGTNLLSSTDPYKSIANTAKSQGWFLAGAWFMKHVYLSETINRTINTTPTVNFTGKATASWVYDILGSEAYLADVVLKRAKQAQGGSGSVFYGSSAERDAARDDTTGSTWGAFMGSGLASIFTGIDIGQLKNDARHPIIVMSEMGSRLITSTVAAMVGIMAIAYVGGLKILGTGPDATAAMVGAAMFLMPLIATLWVIAFMTTNLLPMLPFIIWLGAIIGWTVLVVEAIIAAPLWAIMHLHPSGDDMFGRGGNGYPLVLGLLLRPVLLIFGFIAALVLSEVFGELINKIFFQVWASSQNGVPTGFSLASFIQPLFATVIYVTIMMTFITKMFSVVTMIADQLLKWMGGPSEQLGAFAGEFATRGQQGMMAAAGFANQATQGAVSGGGRAVNSWAGRHANATRDKMRAYDDANSQMAGKGDMFRAMDNSFGSGKEGQAQSRAAKAEVGQAIASFGGDDTQAAQGFAQRYQEAFSGENSQFKGDHGSAFKHAMENTLEKDFGPGANKFYSDAISNAQAQGGNLRTASNRAINTLAQDKKENPAAFKAGLEAARDAGPGESLKAFKNAFDNYNPPK